MRFTVAATALLAAPGAYANLNKLAKAAGKLYFGSATDNGELTDSAYVGVLSDADEFGQITAGNGQKWQFTEPSQGKFSFDKGDEIVNFAKKNGQILRCHTLVWHSQLPSWVSSGSWTAAQLTDIINTHISNEVGHYRGECYAWDVVNEALLDDGTFRTSVFYNVLGTSFIPIAFKAAEAADPAAKLYYNDYNIEWGGAKVESTINIVKSVQQAGGRIDGVGLQGHFIVGQTPSKSTLTSVLNSYVALGVEVAYTEIDVRFSSLPPSASGYEQQANDYAAVVGACLAVEKCVGITVWDFDDKYSWIPSTFSGQGEACLFWSNLTAKPAYHRVQSLLSEAATGPITTTSKPPTTTTLITSTRPTTTSPGSAPAPHWGQCGGIGWSGPTTCQEPFGCQKQNDWYSQCL